MVLTTGMKRSAVILQMKAAIKAGKSGSAFFREMAAVGLSYRHQTMQEDWRGAGNIEKKTGLLKYVRKDRFPSPALYAESRWKLSREFLYKLKIYTRLKPGEPLESRFVNIGTDIPMTPKEWEFKIREEGVGESPPLFETLVKIDPIVAIKKI